MGSHVAEINDANFEQEVLRSDQPVLVDFWAPWCGPCRQIAPMIDELSTANFGSVKVAKVNIDDNPKAPSRYGVTSIPTLMVFKGGQVVETFIGAQPKQRLQDALNRHIDVEMA